MTMEIVILFKIDSEQQLKKRNTICVIHIAQHSGERGNIINAAIDRQDNRVVISEWEIIPKILFLFQRTCNSGKSRTDVTGDGFNKLTSFKKAW